MKPSIASLLCVAFVWNIFQPSTASANGSANEAVSSNGIVMSLSTPRIEPTIPVAGAPILFRVDCNFCGGGMPPTRQMSGNVITLVQPIYESVNIPAPQQVLDHNIGPLPAGDYIVRYSAFNSDNNNAALFGPVDVPFRVTGTAQAIPLLSISTTGLLVGLLLLSAAIAVRRYSTH